MAVENQPLPGAEDGPFPSGLRNKFQNAFPERGIVRLEILSHFHHIIKMGKSLLNHAIILLKSTQFSA